MRCAFASIPLVFTLATSAPVHAQSGGAIAGRVLDHATELPVASASLTLLTETGRTVRRTTANQAGQFLLPINVPGRYRLHAVSIGYGESVTAPVEVRSGDTLFVIVRVNVQAIRLPSLEVVSMSSRHVNAGMDAFQFRLQRGLGGTFITREQIEQRAPRRLSDLLTHAGAIVWGDELSGAGITMGRSGCAPMVYVDGIQVTYPYLPPASAHPRDLPPGRALEAVNMVSPSSVEGIEVYRGAASLPAEFGGSTGACGVIAIWTRRGR